MLEKFEDLLGRVLSNVEVEGDCGLDERLIFTLEGGDKYKLYHVQDCCELVQIEDVCGNLSDLIGSPILMAEEVTSGENPEGLDVTWTFYKLATIKGSVTIRWCGESNGYYSESVDFAAA